ncbi:ABC transporter permease [Flagellimonas meridianipacifica]|uniref:Putative ABC transport system permease protein n=1 Tax=Flagellimonas meridianipacifica TaxID=1080225 RepID=A0A2T0MJK1_9FLAO|nr:ABC transporter permease [Allomuricauda pacifica]PRX57743.1 putative ABC transport system permease protein [Allomuricauda pacifica]
MRFLFDRNTWQEIFGSISKNKIRTIITIIGVLWGIFVYIAMSGAAKGLDNGFEREFETVAMNSLFAWGQSTSKPYEGFKTGRQIRLQLGDVSVLQNRIPEIQYIAPRNAKGVFGDGTPPLIVRGQKSNNFAVYGDFPVFTSIATKKIYDGGRFINDDDIEQARKVCVIGEQTQKELFEKDENPIGQYIRVDNIYFQVIGVHKFVPGGGFETDGDIYIPFTTYQRLYNTGDEIDWLTIAAYDDADVVQVEEDVKTVLKRIHKVDPTDERAFGSFNLGEIFNRIMGFSKGLTFLSFVIGIATILAGVIGIGNILLISVKERTKELGVRRALGATPREVRSQIILESVFLTFIAGIIGIILGAATLNLVNNLTQGIDFPYTNPTVPIPYVVGAMLLMVILGTLIGLIPAQRAVSIRPIDALREE